MVGPRCNRCEFVGELDPLEGQLEARVEEVGDRDSFAAGGWADDPVWRGLEIAIGRRLEHLAEIHQIHPGTGGRVDHLPTDLDLETADLVLENERQEPGIRVQTDTLAVAGIRGRRGVADDLEVDVALGQEAVVEVIHW